MGPFSLYQFASRSRSFRVRVFPVRSGNHGFVRTDSQELLPVQGLDPHPEEEDGDESDDEDHEEGDGDADEGGGVDAERVVEAVGVDHHLLLLVLAGEGELDVVGGQNLKKNYLLAGIRTLDL